LIGAAERPAAETLLQAVQAGDAVKWQALLTARADVKARDAGGDTALHLAALNHDLAAVNALLAAGAEADAKNVAGATPLIYGAGHPEIVRALLARGANPNAVSTTKNTPLMSAVVHPESYEAARLLIDAGADVHAKKTTDVEVALGRAVIGGDPRTIELLLAQGAAKDPKSAAAALSTASFGGKTDVVQLLLSHGADPNLNPEFGGHALNIALLGEEAEVARLLIEKGADPNLRSPNGHGTPPMVFAAYNQSGDASVARALVTRGVDVNAANDQGATALSYALRSGPHTPLVEYLRSAGAKLSEPVRTKRLPDRAVPPAPDARAALVRERLPATLQLLQRSSDAFLDNGFVQKSNCTSCHGQDLPAVAYGLARERGLRVNDVSFGRQLSAQISRWSTRAENARQMTSPVPGSPVSIAYGLFGLRAARYPADDMTDAMVRYLLRTQRPDGAWTDPIRRPPMEDGTFVATGWVALAVRDYAPTGLKRAAMESQARSAGWLARQKPTTHNESVFQLLGLHWSGVPRSEMSEFATKLAKAQRADGGWAQLSGLESDAWATGSALYALHEAGAMSTNDPVYQRGVAFLLRTQFEDGSWWVRTRSWPFQPHFNGQFPHGKDQWISQGATAWAAMALLLTLEPVKPAPAIPTAQELIAVYSKSPAAQRRKVETTATTAAAATVDFARDIQPILKRSCVGCHGGDKPRGEFALISRESLLKGGQSGEPAIAPGYSDDSPLIQYVSGKIEDLEMPPLDRREKYPALTVAEIDVLRAWIDSGAPWGKAEAVKTTSVNSPTVLEE
jgi:ankyrin repeat protein